jgi:DNA repair exonuclease SbcCD ATPase subunit
MKLLKAIYKKFKGFHNFELVANGNNIEVFGDNATGKTSAFDGICWLLYDKDSQNKKDFDIKTRDAAGNVIPNIEHEVEAVFEINGKPTSLRKVYAEKYVKKRGSISSEFTGHETSYYIDGVPKSKKEYDAFINNIADESIFKLLTNPLYFNEQLHWQKRRELLIEICGEVSDREVILSNKELAKLPAILNGRKLDDHRKVIAARRSVINDELGKIPIRIDEISRTLPDLTGALNREVLQTEINSLKSQQQAKQQELVRITSGGEIAEQQKQLSQLDSQLLDLQNKHRTQYSDVVFTKKSHLQNLKSQLSSVTSRIDNFKYDIKNNNDRIAINEEHCERLRVDWHTADNQKFEFNDELSCPTCKQSLPEDQITKSRETALSQFNLDKSKKIESINSYGQNARKMIRELQDKNTEINGLIAALESEKQSIEQSIIALETEIAAMGEIPDISSNPEYQALSMQKLSIQEKINNINTEKESVLRQIKADIGLIEIDMAARERSIAQLDNAEASKKRIAELNQQEKELSAEYEKLEGELYLTDQFVIAKVNMLESRINSKFKFARFKMFDVQINGGLNECCETTFNGVPYGGGLNNAGRINVGLDIINTLSDHFNFVAPIFVDNAEAVTKLTEVKGQVIKLVVSEPDKVLRVVGADGAGKEQIKLLEVG